MEECIRDLRTWLIDGKLLLNDDETESLVIGTRQQFNKLDPLSLQVGDHNIDPSFNAGYLGAVIDNSPSMNKSVKPVYKLNLFITDTPGQGVDNLRYMYHFLSAVTQTLTLSVSDSNTRTCLRRSISFSSKICIHVQHTITLINLDSEINKTKSFGLNSTY